MTLITGDSGTFSTTPSGTGPFEFQWTHNGVDSAGATNASYTVGPVSPGDAGTYCVIVTCVLYLHDALPILTVNEPTTATGPNDMTLVTGDSGTFSTTPSGTGPFEFQWTHNGVDRKGTTNNSNTVWTVSAGDAVTYSVIVTGVVNSVTNCATL